MFEYCVYVLLCRNNKLYTGYARNIKKRFEHHCNGTGAKFTRSNPPIRIVHIELYSDISSAMKREIEIKSMTRKQKEELCNGCRKS